MHVGAEYLSARLGSHTFKIIRGGARGKLLGYNMWEFGKRIYECILPVKDDVVIKTHHSDKDSDLKQLHFEDRPISQSLLVRLDGAAPLKPNPLPLANVVGSVLKRFGTNTGVNRKFLRGLRIFTMKWLDKNIKPLNRDTDLSVATWLKEANYPNKRKIQLQQLSEHCATLNPKTRRRGRIPRRLRKRLKVKSFIKDESYPSVKYPRSINSRDDWFKTFSGPLFEAIGRLVGKNKHFIKYVPVADRMQTIWERLHRKGGTYFASDYTSFEAHFTAAVMKNCEFLLYRHCVKKLHVEERDKMEFIISVLSGRNDISFKNLKVGLDATRMSGEMNTSLGNGFSNLMLMLYTYQLKGCGLVDIFVEGDDSIAWVQYPENVPTVEDFKKWGFIIKLESSRNLNELSFCGQVFDPDDGIVITEPKHALLKFGWTNKKYVLSNDKVMRQLTLAGAYSMAFQYNGCPMLSCFSRRLVQLLRGVTVARRLVFGMGSFYSDRYQEMEQEGLPVERVPGPGTRALFERLYGIPVAYQRQFEEEVKNLQLGDSIRADFFPYDKNEIWMADNKIVDGCEMMIRLPTKDYLDYLQSVCPHHIKWPTFYKNHPSL